MNPSTPFRIVCAAFAVAAIALAGCDAGTPKLDEQHLEKATAGAFEMRAIFDKVEGDWEKLTPDDKKTFIDAWGGDEKVAKTQWDYMKNPTPRGGPVMNQPQGQ